MSEYPSFQGEYFRKKSGFHHREASNQVAVFSHLHHDEELMSQNIHWGFEILKEKINQGKLIESNECCKEMLESFRSFFKDYQIPSSKVPSRDLEDKIDSIQNYLTNSMIMTLGMETALQYLKLSISRLPINVEINEIRQVTSETIDTFIREKIELPSSIIAGIGAGIITNGDVILIYDYSSTVVQTLILAKTNGKSFRVIVADSRARLEGKKALKELAEHKIKCIYILISNVSYHMPEVTRVIMGAEGLTNNCCLLNKVGTAMICCIANAFKKPVLVCVEIYKLSEKVQIDSICFNVLHPEAELTNTQMYKEDCRIQSPLHNYESNKLLKLNLKYDLTPAQYIDMLVTEVGSIPVSSVPVILREFRT
jgi:translation initiation factor eIF-2B subunit delta